MNLKIEIVQKNSKSAKKVENVIKEAKTEMRSRLIDKCKKIFQLEKNEQFDQYIKEKDPEERRSKLKKFIVGNINFITELMKIKILSKKVGPDCLKNLYDRYQKSDIDKTLKESTIEAIIKFADKFGRIIYEEEKNMNGKDKEEFKLQIDDIFKKLEKIKKKSLEKKNIKKTIKKMTEEIPNIKTETTQETPLNLNTEENITEDDKSDNGLSQISEKKVNKMKKSHSKKKIKKKKKRPNFSNK